MKHRLRLTPLVEQASHIPPCPQGKKICERSFSKQMEQAILAARDGLPCNFLRELNTC